jgi:citrate lyase beta subunit
MAPGAGEVSAATGVCEAYEAATAIDQPAAILNGKVITNPDYRVALLTLARAGARG